MDEDEEPLWARDYVEIALLVAQQGEGQYSTSTITKQLSSDYEGPAPTKLPSTPGAPVIVQSETYVTNDGAPRSLPTQWHVDDWLLEAGQLCEQVGVSATDAADVTDRVCERTSRDDERLPALLERLEELRGRGPQDSLKRDGGDGEGGEVSRLQEAAGPADRAVQLLYTSRSKMSAEDNGDVHPPPPTPGPLLQVSWEGAPTGSGQDVTHMDLPEVVQEGELEAVNQSAAPAGGDSGESAGEDDSERSVQLSGSWSPDALRSTCKHKTREAILDAVPAAREDDRLLRYVVFALFTTFYDNDANLRVLPNDALLWMDPEAETGKEVIEYIQEHMDLKVASHIPNRRCRLIKRDGLPHHLYSVVDEDLSQPIEEAENRVYILSGKAYTRKQVTQTRNEIAAGLREERHRAPSPGAQKTFEMLNFKPGSGLRDPRHTSSITDHIEDAYAYVRRMDIDPDVSKDPDESWIEWEQKKRRHKRRQRHQYLLALRAIEDQNAQYYTYSSTGRTDRVFGFNRGVMDLPSEVRAILYQDFYEVDLRSAHLLIAAWLWDADRALEKLTDPDYSIWDDLMEHLRPCFEEQDLEVPAKGAELYAEVKAALKIAVYSTVYGMDAACIQAQVTRSLKDILGPDVGKYVRAHPVIEELLRKRDEKLQEMEVGVMLHGPTGIRIEIEQGLHEDDKGENDDRVDPRSAMATLCQSYEQAAMQVILELERHLEREKSRNHFHVGLWLHDGAYVNLRSERARSKNLKQRLQERCEELASFAGKDTPLPAFFEIESIDAPSIPQREDDTCTNNSISSTTSQNSETSSPTTGEESRPTKTARGAASPSREDLASPDSGTSTSDAPPSSRSRPPATY